MKLPPFGSISPQLATLVTDVPSGGPYVYEIKYDGYRAMAWLDEGTVRIATRSGRDWTPTFREIAGALARLRARCAILDGEVAYVEEDGRTDFQKLQNALGSTSSEERGRLVYHVFDLLHLDGVDLRDEPLSARKELLRALLVGEGLPLRMSDDVADGKAFFREVCKHRLEGIVGKRTDRPYVSGRTPDWIKLKCQLRQEFVVVGFTPQKETRGALGALLLAVRERGGDELRYVGRVGSGFSQATLRDLAERLAGIAVGSAEPPTVRLPSRIPHVTWVKPELVAEVRFSEWTSEGILRHPSFQGLREDHDPADVVRETPAAPTPAAAPRSTRRELARYFEEIAAWMFPFVASRPLVLLPAPSAETLSAARLETRTAGRREVLLATEASQLVTLAEHDTVEVRGWGARMPQWDRADWLVFHLDPAEGLPFARVVDAAFELRDALLTANLEAWTMTTGGRALRIVVPIARRYDWTTVRGAAEAIAAIMASAAPERYVAVTSTSAAPRAGRIAIDVVANAEGGSTALPYSPCAPGDRAEGIAVAMPLAWDQLRGLEVDPRELTPRRVPKLVAGARARHALWAGLLDTEQIFPKALLDAALARGRAGY